MCEREWAKGETVVKTTGTEEGDFGGKEIGRAKFEDNWTKGILAGGHNDFLDQICVSMRRGYIYHMERHAEARQRDEQVR